MRRWLVVFLLAVLPVQFSWAAVAVYCGHESGSRAAHVGHHEHEAHDHGASVQEPQKTQQAGQKAPAALDLDCGHCHGVCAGVLLDFEPVRLTPLSAAPTAFAVAPLAAHCLAPPERPQWPALA